MDTPMRKIMAAMQNNKGGYYLGSAVIILSAVVLVVGFVQSIFWFAEIYDLLIEPKLRAISLRAAWIIGLSGLALTMWVFVVNLSKKYELSAFKTWLLVIVGLLATWVCYDVAGRVNFLNYFLSSVQLFVCFIAALLSISIVAHRK